MAGLSSFSAPPDGGAVDVPPGSVALVTGAGSGLGATFAEMLARRDCHVAVNDINDSAHDVAKRLDALGCRATAHVFDVTDADAVGRAVAEIADSIGPPHILVNNAGWIDHRALVVDMDPADWARELAINLTGPFLCSRAVLPHMYRAGGGRIVNMSSVAAEGGMYGAAGYAATKAGVLGLTKTLALEGARWGVTCNAVCAGPIDKEAGSSVREDIRDAMRRRMPGPRFGSPDGVARLVCFLALDADPYLTGQAVGFDGGATLYHLDVRRT